LLQLERQTNWVARYLYRLPPGIADALRAQVQERLTDGCATCDLDATAAAYNTVIDTAGALGTAHAVTHLRNLAAHAFTFVAHRATARLLFGHKERLDLAAGVLERVMR